jgi:hypothetical protein
VDTGSRNVFAALPSPGTGWLVLPTLLPSIKKKALQ